MAKFVTYVRPTIQREFIDKQYLAMENLCSAYNSKARKSTLRFYAYGGSLYHKLYPKARLPCLNTADVDGFLLVIPNDVAITQLIKPTGQVERKVQEAWDEARKLIFNIKALNKILKQSSTRNIQIKKDRSITFKPTTTGDDNFDPKLGDDNFFNMNVSNDLKRELVKSFTDPLEKVFPLLVDSGGVSDFLDVHIGILHPNWHPKWYKTAEPITRAFELYWSGIAIHSNVYICNPKYLLLDQLKTAIERLTIYIENAHLRPDKLPDCLEDNACRQGIEKTRKTLCRVRFLSTKMPTIILKDLLNFYADKPFLSDWKYLRSKILEKRVESLNMVLNYGYDGPETFSRIQKQNKNIRRWNRIFSEQKPTIPLKSSGLELVPSMTIMEVVQRLYMIYNDIRQNAESNRRRVGRASKNIYASLSEDT